MKLHGLPDFDVMCPDTWDDDDASEEMMTGIDQAADIAAEILAILVNKISPELEVYFESTKIEPGDLRSLVAVLFKLNGDKGIIPVTVR